LENPVLFGETDFTVGFIDPMFPIRCATVVELRLQRMGHFSEKPQFTMENFKFREAVKWGLKIFAPNYQKAHPYATSGRTNRLSYVAVTSVDLSTALGSFRLTLSHAYLFIYLLCEC